MKILFVTNSSGPDYMSDVLFHGGKSIYRHDFYESKKMWYMYDDFVDKKSLYGRGFTLYGKIKKSDYNELPDNIIDLISNKFFDKIIYGSICRCDDYFDLVSKVYNKKDIIVIDGEDVGDINNSYVNKSIYFKRELYKKQNDVHPINFGIPEELILTNLTSKSDIISNIIPDNSRNYKYEYEEDYYNHYSKCWFAITKKKAGWDCLRHYEIMMNGCVPLFENLENCPELTLTDLPKKELILFNKERIPNLEHNEFILDYVKNNLTTKKIFNKVINY